MVRTKKAPDIKTARDMVLAGGTATATKGVVPGRSEARGMVRSILKRGGFDPDPLKKNMFDPTVVAYDGKSATPAQKRDLLKTIIKDAKTRLATGADREKMIYSVMDTLEDTYNGHDIDWGRTIDRAFVESLLDAE